MVPQPRPWDSLFGGGLIDNDEPLVRVPIRTMTTKTVARHYRAADLTKVFAAVTTCRPLSWWSARWSLQRIAWDNGISGLFPAAGIHRATTQLGSTQLMPNCATATGWPLWPTAIAKDRRRVKIERSLQAAEELAGRHVWQSWHTDYQGRMYTGNKFVTTQGQDHEKAQLSFLPTNTNQDSPKLLLMAAAGHYGMSQELERTPHLG